MLEFVHLDYKFDLLFKAILLNGPQFTIKIFSDQFLSSRIYLHLLPPCNFCFAFYQRSQAPNILRTTVTFF